MASHHAIERGRAREAGGGVQSVLRATALLEQVAGRGEAGVSELARAAGLHVATAHNLLRTLAGAGYLVNLGGRYRVGPAAERLALHWAPLDTLPQVAAAAMARMSERSGEAGSLGLLVGDRCEVIPVSPGTGDVVARPTRQSFDPLTVATGRLLAACCDEPRRARLVASHVAQRHDQPEGAWHAELARVAAEQVVVLRRAHAGAVDAVGVALHGPGGRIIAALGAHCPHFRGTPAHLAVMLEALQDAAREVAHSLGAEPLPAPIPPVRLRAAVRRQASFRSTRRAHA